MKEKKKIQMLRENQIVLNDKHRLLCVQYMYKYDVYIRLNKIR